MRTTGLMLSLLLLLSVLSAPCGAGNKELMQKWAAKKQYVRDQILEELRKQGDLPQNGTIRFEARVQSGSDGKVTTFEVDSVEVFDATAGTSAKTKATAEPYSGGGAGMVREENIDLGESASDGPGTSGTARTGASGTLGTKRTIRVHGKLTEAVLDIPGTAVISDAIKLEGGKPVEEPHTGEKTGQPAAQVPGTASGPAETHQVGDEKTEKSWWKIW